MKLQQCNSSLQSDLKSANEAYRQLDMEKTIIVESLNATRDLNKELQDRLKSLKVSGICFVKDRIDGNSWVMLGIANLYIHC